MKISFITVCMGRLHHLKQTLPRNIEDTADIDREFIILNYNSKDRMNEYLWNHFQKEIKEGLIKLYHTSTPRYFRTSHSRNMASKQATGDILLILDCDNFLVEGFSEWVIEAFTENIDSVCSHRSDRINSVGGKIAISSDNFIKMRGYNEKFKGWGFEDVDLIIRAIEFDGLTPKRIPVEFMEAILHTNEERFTNYEDDSVTDEIKYEEGCEIIKYHGITQKEFQAKYDGSKYFEKPGFDYWAMEWKNDPEAVEYFGYAEWREHIPFWDLHYVPASALEKFDKYKPHEIEPKKLVNPNGWGRGRVKRLFI